LIAVVPAVMSDRKEHASIREPAGSRRDCHGASVGKHDGTGVE
jgi:hypothetical protein